MEPSVINAMIAAVAAVSGGGIAAAASYLNTRHKLKELELAASQKLRENYLQNAREYTKAIYVPLALAVSRLYDAYNAYQQDLSLQSRRNLFNAAIETWLSELRKSMGSKKHGVRSFFFPKCRLESPTWQGHFVSNFLAPCTT